VALKGAIKKKEEDHARQMAELDKAIFKAKKDAHYRAYETTKLKSHCSRYQILLRKNGVTDNDVSIPWTFF
jgi:hypothetical protein